ncbi:MAG TPA: hypothetical protein VLF66_02040, partial [Thermoanaerobaculia bacterium]|nr:hypothetical protein [Thermoanaerobaculia bacterium]
MLDTLRPSSHPTALLALVLAAGWAALACAPAGETGAPETAPTGVTEMDIAPDVEERLARFAPTTLSADTAALSAEDRQVLDLLVQAAQLMDEIFLRQAWVGNPELRDRLQGLEGEGTEAVWE